MTRLRLEIKAGEAWGYTWPILDRPDGTPVELTGWTVRGQIRSTTESPTVLYEWSTGAGNVVFEAPSGQTVKSHLTIHVPPVESLGWDWEDAVFDLFLTDPGARSVCVAEGPVRVRRAVTRD